MPGIEIRRIRREEWWELREMRLRALLDAPDAFTATHEQDASNSEQAWRDWAANGAEGGTGFAAIAIADDDWLGMAVGAPHQAYPGEVGLFAMWVDPSARGEGIGRSLVEDVVSWARAGGFTSIRLRVTITNDAAIRLYERCGFIDNGGRAPLREGSDVIAMSMTRLLT